MSYNNEFECFNEIFEGIFDWESVKDKQEGHIKIDEKWVEDSLDLASLAIKRRAGSYYGKQNWQSSVPQLAGIDENSLKYLTTGIFKKSLTEFLQQAFNIKLTIPSVDGVYKEDPCGDVTWIHLSLEWIRHFMGVLYEKDEFKRALGGVEFFPFENRDHFIHPIQVALIGCVFLESPVTQEFKTAIQKILKNVNLLDIRACSTIGELVALIWLDRERHLQSLGIPIQSSIANKDNVLNAWAAIAFWHDSGYDAATWQLLTYREASHCRILENAYNPNSFSTAITEFVDAIRGKLPSVVPGYIGQIHQAYQNRPHHFMYAVEGCYTGKGIRGTHWGRFHALLSAYEFVHRFDQAPTNPPYCWYMEELAAAIAMHHEPFIDLKKRMDSNNAEAQAKQFYDNPLGELLYFVDDIASIHRPQIRWQLRKWLRNKKQSLKNKGQELIPLEIRIDTEPVYIRIKNGYPENIYKCYRYSKKRIKFFLATKCGREKFISKKKSSFWGDIIKIKSKKNAPCVPDKCQNGCQLGDNCKDIFNP